MVLNGEVKYIKFGGYFLFYNVKLFLKEWYNCTRIVPNPVVIKKEQKNM